MWVGGGRHVLILNANNQEIRCQRSPMAFVYFIPYIVRKYIVHNGSISCIRMRLVWIRPTKQLALFLWSIVQEIYLILSPGGEFKIIHLFNQEWPRCCQYDVDVSGSAVFLFDEKTKIDVNFAIRLLSMDIVEKRFQLKTRFHTRLWCERATIKKTSV